MTPQDYIGPQFQLTERAESLQPTDWYAFGRALGEALVLAMDTIATVIAASASGIVDSVETIIREASKS